MKVYTHLAFDGNCAEAFKFYERALGGKIEIMSTFEGTPAAAMAPPDFKDKIIHGRIRIGEVVVMGADAPPGRYSKPQGMTLTLSTETAADADKFFAALSQGGAVGMPLADTFFAERFGMLTDRFGIPWMVIKERAP